MKDRTGEISALVAKYDQLRFIPVRLEDAFDDSWWSKVGGKAPPKQLSMDISDEGKLVFQ
jgi:cytoplasmic tRNA 2-thiolation protein 2